MGKLNKYHKIQHNDKTYSVCELNYSGTKVPIVMDWNIFKKIKNLEKSWHVNEKGFVVTNHKYEDDGIEKIKEFTLHDVIMRMSENNPSNKSIIHIDKLGVDNRTANLIYDTIDKDISKNLKKKSRTIVLPDDCGVTADELPSYVWYIKEDSTHGDRFAVDVGDIKWKSTASKKVSLKYKLEETKKYMRYLMDTRDDIFEEFSMNGDLNNEGIKLISDFLEISQKAGYSLNDSVKKKNTDKYLKQKTNGLSQEEIILLEQFDPENGRNDFR